MPFTELSLDSHLTKMSCNRASLKTFSENPIKEKKSIRVFDSFEMIKRKQAIISRHKIYKEARMGKPPNMISRAIRTICQLIRYHITFVNDKTFTLRFLKSSSALSYLLRIRHGIEISFLPKALIT